MQPRSTILQIALFGFLLSVCQVTRVNAQEPNFDGKTVRIVVGFSAGGGFDAYARAIARHLENIFRESLRSLSRTCRGRVV